MGLKYFDVVVIVSDGRWSEGDASLLSAIYAAGIRCVLVRSKAPLSLKIHRECMVVQLLYNEQSAPRQVDQAVEAGEVDKNQSPAETLNEVLLSCTGVGVNMTKI